MSRRLARALAGTGAVNMLTLGLGLITGVLTARGLEPSDRGLLIALTMWAGVAGTMALTGFDDAIVFHSAGRKSRSMAIIRTLRETALMQAILGAMILAAIAMWLVRPTNGTEYLVVIVVASIVPMNTINLLALATLRVTNRMRAWNALRILPNVVYAASVLTLVAVDKLTVTLGVLTLATGSMVTAVIASRLIRPSRVASRMDQAESEGVRAYGRRLLIAMLPQNLNPRIDQVLMSIVLAPATLGIYSVAAALGSIVQAITLSIDQVLFPRLVLAKVSRQKVFVLAAASILIASVVSVALLASAPGLIGLVYGQEYIDAARPLALVLLAATIRAGGSVISVALKASGRLSVLAVANGTGFAVGVVAFILLANRGMMGVAASAVCSALATFLIALWSVARDADLASERRGLSYD